MSFGDFPEQQPVITLLQRSLERGRLSHAYLFQGNELATLEGVATALAKALNCLQPPKRSDGGVALESCDTCLNCRRIEHGNHPDVQWVRPESKSRIILIDQMRDLIRTVNLKPTEAEFKVAVIVAADRLKVEAANAFLKTLEEPPPRSILILLSTEPQQLLETIQSRCLRLSFAGQDLHRDPASLAWLSHFAESAASNQAGLLGRYRLLGTLLARLTLLKTETEKALQARSPLEKFEDADLKLREKWEEELAAAIEAEYRRRRSELLRDLQVWLRDIWITALALGEDLLHFPNLAGASRIIAQRIAAAQAIENLQIMERLQRILRSNVQEALALEVALLNLSL